MSKYIEADAVEKAICKRVYAVEVEDILAEMANAPSIDIVRCKDCKHWTKGDEVYGICNRCTNTRQMRLDDFCSRGEVRDE